MGMNESEIRNGLRKHWHWLKDTDNATVAEFVIGMGNRDTKQLTFGDFL